MAAETAKRPGHLVRGTAAEERAYQYLLMQGLSLVCRNYRSPYGEIDLIMAEVTTLVIIEVRFRHSDKYGSALESITPKKQSRIIATTQHYLSSRRTDSPIRFDVVALSGDGSLQWVKNAF